MRVFLSHFEHLLWRLLVSDAPLVRIFFLWNWAGDPHKIVVLQVRIRELLWLCNLGRDCLLLALLRLRCLRDDRDFVQADVFFDGEFFNDRLQDVGFFIVAVIAVHAASCPLLLLKCLLNVVDLVEPVEFVDNLTQNGLAVADQQVKELFILFNVVGLLLAHNHRVILAILLRLAILFFLYFFLRVPKCVSKGSSKRVRHRLACSSTTFPVVRIASTFFLLLRLQLLNVTLAEVVTIPNQFLAVEACHHAVLEGFLVPQELGEHRAELKMVLA